MSGCMPSPKPPSSAIDNGHIPALESQVFANNTSDFKYSWLMVSANEAHNHGVDRAIILHLLQTLPSSKGALSSRGQSEHPLFSLHRRKISDKISGSRRRAGATRPMC